MTCEELKAAYEAAVQKCSELEKGNDELKKSNEDQALHIEPPVLKYLYHTGELKTKSIQSAFIPRSLENEPLRMRYSGSCGSPRLRHELPCNQHTTSALIVKSFRGINARSLVTILFRSKCNKAKKKTILFPEVNATFTHYFCVYF